MINSVMNFTGNKFALLPQLIPLFNTNKSHFIDLFTGGGSVYINVVHLYEKILINDIIEDLIEIHKRLIDDSENIINKTKKLSIPCKDNQDEYIKLRKSYNLEKTPEKLWALMLSCTNNMMRFNKNLDFNQTWGKRSWNSVTDNKVKEFLDHISKYKNKLFFSSRNFYNIPIQTTGMYYCDPPYVNSEAGYNSYWSVELEIKLYNYLKEIDKIGGSFALSGVIGEHKDGKRSFIIDQLIKDGFNYTILYFDYEKVARKKKSKNSQEILIYNYQINK